MWRGTNVATTSPGDEERFLFGRQPFDFLLADDGDVGFERLRLAKTADPELSVCAGRKPRRQRRDLQRLVFLCDYTILMRSTVVWHWHGFSLSFLSPGGP